jgi:hypothetical protein
MNVGRIQTEHDVTAMVALDTAEMLARRVCNLLAHDRRIAMYSRWPSLADAPTLVAGLTLDGPPKLWSDARGSGLQVDLKPGVLQGFSFVAYPDENDTEAADRKRYHALADSSDDYRKRRRQMTEVRIVGGLEGLGPSRYDLVEIRRWNDDGVGSEVVVAFDGGPERDR